MRPVHPLLAPEAWEDLLRAAGFARVEIFPQPGGKWDCLGQHVILAQTAETPETSSDRGQIAPSAEGTNEITHDLSDLCYEVRWELKPGTGRKSGHAQPQPAHSWIILVDASGVGEKLAQDLASRGQQVVQVLRGDHFQSLSAGLYRVNPSSREDLGRVFREVLLNSAGGRRLGVFICGVWTRRTRIRPRRSPGTGSGLWL